MEIKRDFGLHCADEVKTMKTTLNLSFQRNSVLLYEVLDTSTAHLKKNISYRVFACIYFLHLERNARNLHNYSFLEADSER